MIELVEKALLTAMGAVSMGQKKGEELLVELKQRFNVSEEEGKALLEKIQESAKANQAKLEEIAQEEVQKASQRLGLVTSEDLTELQKKVQQLEKKVKELAG